MKLKVKSQADLKRIALASGAELEYQGSKFNTTRERVQMARPEPAPGPEIKVVEPPKPEPKSEPASVQESFTINLDMEPVAQAVSRSNDKIGELLAESLKSLTVQPTNSSQPNKWLFIIKRDARGFIESVEATPKL